MSDHFASPPQSRGNRSGVSSARALERGKELLDEVLRRGRGEIGEPLEKLRVIAEENSDLDDVVDQYMMALTSAARNRSTQVVFSAISASQTIVAKWPDSSMINASHACTLATAISRAYDFDASALVRELVDLAARHGNDDFIDQRLALGVRAAMQHLQVDIPWAMECLRGLANLHLNDKTIVSSYLDAVVERAENDPQAALAAGSELDAFLAASPYLEPARHALADVLLAQIVAEVRTEPEAWRRLADLANRYEQDPSIVRHFASGMSVAVVTMDMPTRQWVVSVMADLVGKNPQDHNLGESYMRTLYNTSIVQRGPELHDTLQRMRRVAGHFPDDDDIARLLALALGNLAGDTRVGARAPVIAELRDLAGRFPGRREIAEVLQKYGG